jgi:hypothetical protein
MQGGSPHSPFDGVNGVDFLWMAGSVTGPTEKKM